MTKSLLSLLSVGNLHGVCGSDLESTQRALGLRSLDVRLKLNEGNVATTGDQTYFLEPRKPNKDIVVEWTVQTNTDMYNSGH